MKKGFFAAILALTALFTLTSAQVEARHHRHCYGGPRSSFSVNFVAPPPAPAYYYAPAPVVYTQPAPVVYTQPAPVYYVERPCYTSPAPAIMGFGLGLGLGLLCR